MTLYTMIKEYWLSLGRYYCIEISYDASGKEISRTNPTIVFDKVDIDSDAKHATVAGHKYQVIICTMCGKMHLANRRKSFGWYCNVCTQKEEASR